VLVREFYSLLNRPSKLGQSEAKRGKGVERGKKKKGKNGPARLSSSFSFLQSIRPKRRR